MTILTVHCVNVLYLNKDNIYTLPVQCVTHLQLAELLQHIIIMHTTKWAHTAAYCNLVQKKLGTVHVEACNIAR